VHHLALPSQPDAVRMREVAESKAALEALLGRSITAFAYPYSRVDDRSVDAVRAAGFTTALVVDGRGVTAESDAYRLSRLEAGNWDIQAFARALHAAL
jgi:peptidoglycan/xylan/chitin deacetylase (PgdA/CDA1 family)